MLTLFTATRNETQNPTTTLPDSLWAETTTRYSTNTTAPPLPAANTTDPGPAATTSPSVSTSPIVVSPSGSFVQSTTTSNATNNAGHMVSPISITYKESTFAVVIFVGAVITMFG